MARSALCAAAAPGPRDAAADRLRRSRQDQVQAGSRAVGRRAQRVPGHLLPSRAATSRSRCACTCVENGRGARDRLRRRLFRHAGGFARPTSCPDSSGFAGFRFQEARNGKLDWRKNDWVAFLGASYFRAIGELYQYGLSARGLAVDVAVFGQAGGIPRLHPLLFRAAAAGLGHRDGLRPARRPERHRRLPLRHAPQQGASDGHRQRACSCART